jgi:hypothetical protein
MRACNGLAWACNIWRYLPDTSTRRILKVTIMTSAKYSSFPNLPEKLARLVGLARKLWHPYAHMLCKMLYRPTVKVSGHTPDETLFPRGDRRPTSRVG